MMKWQINHLIGQYKDRTGEGLTYLELANRAGIAKSTVYLLANNKTQRIDMPVMEKLLIFFSDGLGRKLTLDDVVKWEPDRPHPTNPQLP